MPSIGGSEWILIILAILILFGGRKIPEFMRGLGRGIREFNDAKNNVKQELEEGMKEKDQKSTPAPTSSEYQDFLEWKKQQASAPAKNNN